MPTNEKQEVQKRSKLSETEIAEITQLIALCNQQDNLHMPIVLDMLHTRSGKEVNDFLYYDNETLVGYLCMSSWDPQEKEITGMVAPAFRRQHIFRQLFQSAQAECQMHGIECMTLVCEQNSPSGQAFIKTTNAPLDFSEHAMVLKNFTERHRHDPQFQMHPATLEDKTAIIAIMATNMDNAKAAQEFFESLYQTPKQVFYLSTLAGKPLGTLRLDYQNDAVGIYGFIVLPEYRGYGYGRQMLEDILRLLFAEKQHVITLEVETNNQNAIGLYTSCGFQITTTYDYFQHKIL
jgi:ribosomal protein S18 acetylase RimI-like enzyme